MPCMRRFETPPLGILLTVDDQKRVIKMANIADVQIHGGELRRFVIL